MVQTAVSARAGAPVPGQIGKYPIIREVGRGSTGAVYLSHDPFFGRDVAIKVYRHVSDDDPQQARIARKMFINEAQMVGRLQHPNILPIYDAGEEDGLYYVVMEHVQRARTLEAYCRPDNLLPVEDVVQVVFKVARALHYAHKRGVIHRDIKPSNIMLTHDNDVRIIDFGIALRSDSDTSRIEGIAGSPSYMSPEQVQSLEITPATDLYSLGAVLYELLTGFRPFRSSSLARLLNQIVYATPPPIHTLRLGIPEALEDVVAVALQKRPADRHSSGSEFAARLSEAYAQFRVQPPAHDLRGRFALLRQLSFFHDFSETDIRELLRAADWREYAADERIVREGERDDRFYVIVSGTCAVEARDRDLGALGPGDCFGESSYISGATRNVGVRTHAPSTILSVSATLLEQASPQCQLRFMKVFLRTLLRRLQGANGTWT
ncbi:MAG: protein kinase [Chromatiales bacterium]|nr:protein kinase [Chromatiales bacterium]